MTFVAFSKARRIFRGRRKPVIPTHPLQLGLAMRARVRARDEPRKRTAVATLVVHRRIEGRMPQIVFQEIGRIIGDCTRLIETCGFAQYHEPITAEPCGGAHFTRTAAMVIEILNTYELVA